MDDINRHDLLLRAVRDGNYRSFKQLFSDSPTTDPVLLYHCIENSYNDSNEVISGKLEICKTLLSKKEKFINRGEISGPDENETITGRSPFHAQNIHLELLKFLLTEIPSLNQVFQKETVVHRASTCMNGQDFHDLCVFLIDRNAEYLLKNNFTIWKSPLPYILSNAKEILPETLKILLKLPERGYSCDGKNLILSAIQGKRNFEVVDTLIKHGEREMVDWNLEEFNTSLLQAAKAGQLHRLKFLIKPNIDLTETTICHRNVVHLAAWSLRQDKYDEFIKIIWNHKDAKKVLTTLSIGGMTPLHERLRSFRKISIDTLIQLLELDPENINTRDNFGYIMFLAAVRGGKPLNVLQNLVKYGADYKVIAIGRFSALHLASRAGNWDAVSYLAELVEFDVNSTDHEGCTPLFYARDMLRKFEITKELNHKVFDARKIVKFLESKGAKDFGYDMTSEEDITEYRSGSDPERWKYKLDNEGLALALQSSKPK